MSNVEVTELSPAGNANLTDVIYAVQGFTPSSNGTSVYETLQQVFNLFLAQTILHHSGDPNGSVAGSIYQLCFDTSNFILYVCSQTGSTTTAVWKAASGLTIPVSLADGGTNASLTAVSGGVVYSGASALGITSAGSAGNIFQSTGTTAPGWATLSAGSGVTITNNPGSISISATGSGGTVTSISQGTGLTFSSNPITTTGTISLTVPVSVTNGGTGASLVPANGAIVYSNASTLALLAPGTAGQLLQSGGAGTPNWTTPTYPTASGSSGKVLISDGTNNIYSTSIWPNTVGAAGKIIRSDGTSNLYSTSTFADTYSANTILYASSGNTVTGLASTARSVLTTNSSGAPTWVALTDGQIIIGSTAGSPAAANITAGAGISISDGSNSITISGTASPFGWTEVTGTSQAMTADNGYIANNAGLVSFTLPVTAAVGTILNVIGKGAGGWEIFFNSGQTIQVGSSAATQTSGSIASTNRYDSIQLVCTTADTVWTSLGGPQGNITIA